jgi:hypothetical protein
MSLPDDNDAPAPIIRVAQIITIALALGVSIFLAVAVLVLRRGRPFAADPWDPSSPMTAMALVFAAAALVGHAVIQGVMVNGQRRGLAQGKLPEGMDEGPMASRKATETAALLAIFQTGHIVGSAMLEGAAFFATIVYFLEGKAVALLAALVLVGAILAKFPTRTRVEEWLDRQAALLQQERQMGG